ncbi:hypothetical protein RN629_12285 [Sphingomonadaceae bacterium jetA1]|uniref:hypothetical protein n=1 Tax=Facivitalis istanbulensis TaxID=3075838 RepID=UPI003489EE6E
MFGERTLHGADYVAALAHASQRAVHAVRQPPAPRFDLGGKAKPPQLLQPACAERLIEGVAVGGFDRPVRIHVAGQAPVDAGQPFLLDLMAEPVLDLNVGARPQVERHQLGRPLADSAGQILAAYD